MIRGSSTGFVNYEVAWVWSENKTKQTNKKPEGTKNRVRRGAFVSVGHTEKPSNSAMVPPRPTLEVTGLDLAEAVKAFRGWSG